MTNEEKRCQTERIAQVISKLPPETVERLDLIVMGAAMGVAPREAGGTEGVREMDAIQKKRILAEAGTLHKATVLCEDLEQKIAALTISQIWWIGQR